MSSINKCVILILSCLYFCFSTCVFSFQSQTFFSSGEHTSLGDQVQIFFSTENEGIAGYQFQLMSGVKATYGEIVAFADIYGMPDQAISKGASALERRTRFLNAFNTFAQNPNVVPEANEIIAVIREEQQFIQNAIANGAQPETAYHNYGDKTGRRLNCITGGGCEENSWWLNPGRYLLLANGDYDHFGDDAWIAYKTGHDLAIEEAIAANKTKDIKRLELAYAMNAYASHFLSDRFAAGHIRTPRDMLPSHVTPAILGSILVRYMHNEENQYGLHVSNADGNDWIVFGDHSFYSEKNHDNRVMLEKAMQFSAMQIFKAYISGVAPQDGLVSHLLPMPKEIGNASHNDISPLFYWDAINNQLMRRYDVNNVYDYHWTADWWGWSTLALLIEGHGKLPMAAQSQLANSAYAEEAVRRGMMRPITNCPTHISCEAGRPCECTIPANSAYSRYFYFDFPSIQKGNIYQCHFNSFPVDTTVVLDALQFPQGTTYTCGNDCPRSPYTITLNTTLMTQQAGTLIVKFFIPASDYPTQVSATCGQ